MTANRLHVLYNHYTHQATSCSTQQTTPCPEMGPRSLISSFRTPRTPVSRSQVPPAHPSREDNEDRSRPRGNETPSVSK